MKMIFLKLGSNINQAFPDREWMIVKPDGSFRTARQHPQLLTTKLGYSPNKDYIQVEKPGSEQILYLPLDPNKLPAVGSQPPVEFQDNTTPKVLQVRVWANHCEAEDLGEEAAQFFSEFINMPVRLVRTTNRVSPRLIAREELICSPEDEVSCKFHFTQAHQIST
jgi:uncharacterized protein YcbX